MAISDLSYSTPSASVQLPFFDPNQQCDRRASLSDLLAAAGADQAPCGMFRQPAAPALTGFVVQVAPSAEGQSTWLQLRPTADFAAGNITLPLVSQCADGQEVLVSTTHAVTTFTVGANGADAVNGAPTTLAAGGFFRLRFDDVFQDWTRVG